MKLSTVCYIKHKGKTLMLFRDRKPNDMQKWKYNGLGGKFEIGETPEDCVIREVFEESGLKIKDPVFKGMIIYPPSRDPEEWVVYVFVATKFSGKLIDSNEGKLEWISDDKLMSLNIWPGDKLFLPLLEKKCFFSGKIAYDLNDKVISHKIYVYD